jgi:hypothetical protein
MRKRSLASGCVALAALSLAQPAQALSLADLESFPLPAAADAADLSDGDAFVPLAQGIGYAYAPVRVGVQNPSGNSPDPAVPSTWTILSYVGSVTYAPEGLGETEAPVGEIGDLVLVLTSLRQGPYTPGSPTLPPLVLGGYVGPTLADDGAFFVRDPLASAGGNAGVIHDDEGEYFLALRFPALAGAPQSFAFDVALLEPLTDTLRHFNRGFLAPVSLPVPEPATGLSLATGLALLALLRRR